MTSFRFISPVLKIELEIKSVGKLLMGRLNQRQWVYYEALPPHVNFKVLFPFWIEAHNRFISNFYE